jgi:hydroxymethylpyrimidine/phosphomethylpyrimidine kinase
LEPQTHPPFPTKPPVALTIAGFDPSSGAGITADLQVFQAHGLFGTSAITAMTVQSTLGVQAVEVVSKGLIFETLKTLFFDLPPQGIKIGMLGGLQGVEAVSEFLSEMVLKGSGKPNIPIVLDPVIRASSGAELLTEDALNCLCDRLLPQVAWITPNWAELAILAGTEVASMAQAEAAARVLKARYPLLGLIVTGGDQAEPTDLFLSPEGEFEYLAGERVETRSTHGTGCAFSTGFLSNLILQKPALDAARRAKEYVVEAMRLAPGLGGGRGPLNLLWPLR